MSEYNEWKESFLYSQGKIDGPINYAPFEHVQVLLKEKLNKISKEKIWEHLKKSGRKNYPKFKNKLDKWCSLSPDIWRRRVVPLEVLEFLDISLDDLHVELEKDQKRYLFALNGLPDYPDHYRLNHYLFPVKSKFPPYIKCWKDAAEYMVLERRKDLVSSKFDLICDYGPFSIHAHLKGYNCQFAYPKVVEKGRDILFLEGEIPQKVEGYFKWLVF